MRGVILQPNYIPWYGYFELINTSDVFIFLDDAQYTRRDWRNRNKIKTENGTKWLTIPVIKEDRDSLLIKDVMIDNTTNWGKSHYDTLKHYYSKAPYWILYDELLKEMYFTKWNKLSEFDIEFIIRISSILGIESKFHSSSEIKVDGIKEQKLINICQKFGISTYISGPNGQDYIDENNFTNAGIILEYYRYNDFSYEQSFGEFNPYVSVLDLLFHTGNIGLNFLKGIK